MAEDSRSFSFFLLKPDAVRRNLVGRILTRTANSALSVVRMTMLRPTRELVEQHYAEHAGADHFDTNVDFIMSGPVIAGVLRADYDFVDAVARLRLLIGPFRAPQLVGTLRYDYMRPDDPHYHNLIHGSDSPSAALREAELWFGPGGLSPV